MKRLTWLFAMIIISSLLCLVMQANYNVSGFQLNLGGIPAIEDFELLSQVEDLGLAVTYTYAFNGTSLIMATNNLQLTTRFTILEGQYDLSSPEKLVISKNKALSQFKTTKVVGRKLDVLGKQKEIVGVVKEGEGLYLAYDESFLSKQDWKVELYGIALNQREVKQVAQEVTHTLQTKGILVKSRELYKDKTHVLLGMSLIALLFFLSLKSLEYFSAFLSKLIELITYYLNRKYSFNIKSFIEETPTWFEETRDYLLRFTASILGIVVTSQWLYLPTALIPSNFFSPFAYYHILNRLIEGIRTSLSFGFTPMNQLLLLCFAIYTCSGISLYMLIFHTKISIFMPKRQKNSIKSVD